MGIYINTEYWAEHSFKKETPTRVFFCEISGISKNVVIFVFAKIWSVGLVDLQIKLVSPKMVMKISTRENF